MAAAEKREKKGGKGGVFVGALVFLVLTAGAVGGGWFMGSMLAAEASAAKAAPGPDAKSAEYESSLALLPLTPITTNLAAPSPIWVRFEASLLFKEAVDEAMGEAIHQDMLAFLRTVKPHQVEGASGYRHLRTDLDEIARHRSQGAVESVLVRTLLFE